MIEYLPLLYLHLAFGHLGVWVTLLTIHFFFFVINDGLLFRSRRVGERRMIFWSIQMRGKLGFRSTVPFNRFSAL
ncbi:unnamed protein product [Rhizophagus irregularis]|nr:unnamed protein product [Rhizophagus irregularis]